LHDTLAHALSGTAVQLQAVGTLLKVKPEVAADELKKAQAQIKAGLVESRRAIGALRASPLEELGLVPALIQRAESFAENAGISLHHQLDPLPKLPPLTEQTIYRIADEALLNVERHARASEVVVNLWENAGNLTLIIKDNGVGFAQNGKLPDGHFGVMGMKERAKLIGGVLAVESGENAGTTVTFQLSSG
jgi:signal transduction histidine kinase